MKQYLTPEHIKHNLANLPQLVFEVTDACNLRCKYCAYGEFYDDYDCRESKDLSVEWAIRLIDYLVPYWNSGRNVSAQTPIWISFYGGEPLLNFPFIERIVDYVLHGIDCPRHRFSFSMTTNAILLHRYMDFLQEHDFSLLISLDGNEANDAYRMDKAGHSSYARVVENVNALREKYPDYFERRVNFNAVLHNKNSVEEIYRFFKEKYGDAPHRRAEHRGHPARQGERIQPDLPQRAGKPTPGGALRGDRRRPLYGQHRLPQSGDVPLPVQRLCLSGLRGTAVRQKPTGHPAYGYLPAV